MKHIDKTIVQQKTGKSNQKEYPESADGIHFSSFECPQTIQVKVAYNCQ